MCARMGTRTVGLGIVRLHHWWASELDAQGPTKPPNLMLWYIHGKAES